MAQDFPASRDDALKRLQEFLPRAGAAYDKTRNYDHGPDERSNVSLLSPYLRHRLIGEDEVVRAVLTKHRISAAGKFVEEVCWRSYWKGWLEQRPALWTGYLSELAQDRAAVASDEDLAARYAAAMAGESGIAGFDAWSQDLIATGYLHNHARMWFASIWIFTLGLPWTLGADFFYRHLIDGDPASNTLSWRWVAGLHTRGKHYIARAENIRRFTEGRFDPDGQLDEEPSPIDGPEAPLPSRLKPPMSVPPGEPIVLLVNEDDLTPERWPVASDQVKGVALLPPDQSYPGLAQAVVDFRRHAISDAAMRAERAFGCPVILLTQPQPGEAIALCRTVAAEKLVTAQVPVGPARETYATVVAGLMGSGIAAMEVRRDWDSAFWPYARAGFFKLKERIPETLERLGLL
jgi:deoxyribodipyrimidine photo-lyase